MRTFRAVIAAAAVLLSAGACSSDTPDTPTSSTTVPDDAGSPVGDMLDDVADGGPVTVTVEHTLEVDGVDPTRTTTEWRRDRAGNVAVNVVEHRDTADVPVSETVFVDGVMWWRDAGTTWTARSDAVTPALRAATWFDLAAVAAHGHFDGETVHTDGAVIDDDGYLHTVERFDVSTVDGRLARIGYTANISDTGRTAEAQHWTIDVTVAWGAPTPVTVPDADMVVHSPWNSAAGAAANLQATLLAAADLDGGTDLADVELVELAAAHLPANVTVDFDDDIDGLVAGRLITFDDGTTQVCLTIGDAAGDGWTTTDGRCTS